ncbi:uncharacterized protein ACMZJ9_015483 [Mantella aurantiaca]
MYSRDSTQEHQEIPQEDEVDGSSNRSTPERCPSPLYSLDSIRKRHKILRCYQYKRLRHIQTEVKEEVEEICQRGNDTCKEEEVPIKIGTDPGDTRDPQRDVKAEEEEGNVRIKEEEERHKKTKKKILEIGMDGRYRWYNMEAHPSVPPQGDIVEDDITAYVLEEKAVTPNLKPTPYNVGELYACPECDKCFSRKYDRILHRRIHTGQQSFSCPECEKSFPFKSNLEQHQKTHTTQAKPFSCPDCGMHFRTSRILATHQRVHTAKTVYECPQCGQAFIKKLYLKRHERVHIGLKPY